MSFNVEKLAEKISTIFPTSNWKNDLARTIRTAHAECEEHERNNLLCYQEQTKDLNERIQTLERALEPFVMWADYFEKAVYTDGLTAKDVEVSPAELVHACLAARDVVRGKEKDNV